jgi:hypothetical protein
MLVRKTPPSQQKTSTNVYLTMAFPPGSACGQRWLTSVPSLVIGCGVPRDSEMRDRGSNAPIGAMILPSVFQAAPVAVAGSDLQPIIEVLPEISVLDGIVDVVQRASLRIRQPQPCWQVRPENSILRSQVLVLKEEFLVDQPCYIRQQTNPMIAVFHAQFHHRSFLI